MAGPTEGFAEYYGMLADGELLNLALQREELGGSRGYRLRYGVGHARSW